MRNRWERELSLEDDTYSGLGLKDYEVEFITRTKSRKKPSEWMEEM